MKEALFKVKSSLSDYVNQAELGNVVEITRHGKVAAVLIGMKEYQELFSTEDNGFSLRYEKWLEAEKNCVAENFLQGDELENLRSKQCSPEERYGVW